MIVVIVGIAGMCGLAPCAEPIPVNPPADANIGPIDNILRDLHNATAGLKSYQCKIEYLFSQPVLESKSLRTGSLYYSRFGSGSKLRIRFDTLSQDDGPQQQYVEHYIFDGQWLTHIDYQIKQVQKRQLAEANEPIDAFELVKRNFPIIGFSKSDDLKKEFDINLIGEPNDQIHLHLKVKPDSQYKDDYKSVEIWIDKVLGLPIRILAVSTQGDIYEIRLLEALINNRIDETVFEFTIPAGFGKPEIIPLKK
jgi:outer membrane lipoprotein-sorting protein